MKLKTTLFGNVYQFKDVKRCWLKPTNASGMCWRALLRQAHRSAWRQTGVVEMTVADIRNNPVIAYEDDCVTQADSGRR